MDVERQQPWRTRGLIIMHCQSLSHKWLPPAGHRNHAVDPPPLGQPVRSLEFYYTDGNIVFPVRVYPSHPLLLTD